MRRIPALPGTYLLLFRIPRRRRVEVGRLGPVELPPGLYCYAGSARGPGGLAARLRRHVRGGARRHWHLDYVLPAALPAGAVLREGTIRRECAWAAWVRQRAAAAVAGFGASDCRCGGHLFRVGVPSAGNGFAARAARALGGRFVTSRGFEAAVRSAGTGARATPGNGGRNEVRR